MRDAAPHLSRTPRQRAGERLSRQRAGERLSQEHGLCWGPFESAVFTHTSLNAVFCIHQQRLVANRPRSRLNRTQVEQPELAPVNTLASHQARPRRARGTACRKKCGASIYRSNASLGRRHCSVHVAPASPAKLTKALLLRHSATPREDKGATPAPPATPAGTLHVTPPPRPQNNEALGKSR